MRAKFLIIEFFCIMYVCLNICSAQTSDYRDAFLGLYHSTNTNGWNAAIQSPYPNVYIYVEKSLNSMDSIIITDTMQSTPPYRRYAKLNLDSTWYSSGAYYGHFKNIDSINCTSIFPGPSYAFYDGKRITGIGLIEKKVNPILWFLFPNPAANELNIVIPGVNEDLKIQLLDINEKLITEQPFKSTTQLDVATLPKGIYIVSIKGSSINLVKRVVLVD